MAGVCLTAADVLALLALQHRGFRWLEAFVGLLIAVIAGCFASQLYLAQPVWADVAAGLVPHRDILANPAMLYLAVGILGATVMPHNLYLHSSIVQTRAIGANATDRKRAIGFAVADSTASLLLAFFINAAILVLSAAVFHRSGHHEVAEIQDAHRLLSPLLGTAAASVLFAVALLASGQNSTLTGTLAGQIVMEGFINVRLPPWLRRMVTRVLAIVPAVIVAALYGESGTSKLLVLSQVVLSLQLGFAVVPLVHFTSSRSKMGEFANSRLTTVLASLVAAAILGLNGWMLVRTVAQWCA